MSNCVFDNFQGPNGTPANFPNGIRIGGQTSGNVNNIGIAGQMGFGVGICPGPLPAGMQPLAGYSDPSSDNYGNYIYTDGSIMVWIPAFYYKYGTGANGLTINQLDIKPFSQYESVAAANGAGYALHRAFYDGGAVQYGVFVDKYQCSNNSGKASSLKNGVVITSAQRGTLTTATFNSLTGGPANNLGGAIAAAKTRGSNFFCATVFIQKALAMLSLAHGNASTSTTWCGWYHSTYNFPKGNNLNNAYCDVNDTGVVWTGDGNGTYSCGLTGSASQFNKTTHNGQNCGIADLNGNIWEIAPGFTQNNSDPTLGNFYVLKTSVAMKNVTGSNTLATDLWGATGVAALYDDLGLMSAFSGYAVNFSDRVLYMGSATQVLSHATSGTAWQMTGGGIPLSGGTGGSNQFGTDGLWDYSTNEMCPIVGGRWGDGSTAGVWAMYFGAPRAHSDGSYGLRVGLYL